MAEILIAEDDAANRTLMQFVLETQGGHRVRAADGAPGALRELGTAEPDLLVLDVVMPGMTGIELCRRLRRGGALPILLVSGRGEAPDRVAGLRSGADDYLPKPFDPTELLERVNALLRRARRTYTAPNGAIIRAGEVRLHLIERQAWVGERGRERGPIELTPTECRLLYVLLTRPEAVWPREELVRRLWDVEAGEVGSTVALETYVARLRRKLERDSRRPVYLLTVRGEGYRLRPVPGAAEAAAPQTGRNARTRTREAAAPVKRGRTRRRARTHLAA
jgi:two-component system phosphate regulon response regulator OmpR